MGVMTRPMLVFAHGTVICCQREKETYIYDLVSSSSLPRPCTVPPPHFGPRPNLKVSMTLHSGLTLLELVHHSSICGDHVTTHHLQLAQPHQLRIASARPLDLSPPGPGLSKAPVQLQASPSRWVSRLLDQSIPVT